MEATLARYEDMNRSAPNTIRPSVMQGIQQNVSDARDRVQQAQMGKVIDSAIYVSRAEASLRLTEEILRKAEAARARVAGAVSQREMERLQAELELAKVRVDKARHLASESPLSNVRFELDQLREDLQELRGLRGAAAIAELRLTAKRIRQRGRATSRELAQRRCPSAQLAVVGKLASLARLRRKLRTSR